jgi:hypothetical protein
LNFTFEQSPNRNRIPRCHRRRSRKSTSRPEGARKIQRPVFFHKSRRRGSPCTPPESGISNPQSHFPENGTRLFPSRIHVCLFHRQSVLYSSATTTTCDARIQQNPNTKSTSTFCQISREPLVEHPRRWVQSGNLLAVEIKTKNMSGFQSYHLLTALDGRLGIRDSVLTSRRLIPFGIYGTKQILIGSQASHPFPLLKRIM